MEMALRIARSFRLPEPLEANELSEQICVADSRVRFSPINDPPLDGARLSSQFVRVQVKLNVLLIQDHELFLNRPVRRPPCEIVAARTGVKLELTRRIHGNHLVNRGRNHPAIQIRRRKLLFRRKLLVARILAQSKTDRRRREMPALSQAQR